MTPTELKKMTKAELLALAKKKKIGVTASMLKAELVKTIAAGLKPKPAAKSKVKAKTKAKTKTKVKAKTKARAKAKTKAKAVRKTTTSRSKAKGRKAAVSGKPARAKGASSAFGADDMTIRQKAVASKYHLTTGPLKMPPVESMDIPARYNNDRVTMMVRDPWWIFSYWEVTEASWKNLEKKFGSEWEKCRLVLRVFNLTEGRGVFFDVEPGYGAQSWYVNVAPGKSYQSAIGIVGPNGSFVQIAISNRMETPRDTVSDVIDDKWVIPDEVFERIFAASGGYASGSASASGSEELGERIGQRLLEDMGSEAVASFGSAGFQKEQRDRGFWLWVATELILYGATEPDAKVTIQGEEIKLRGDGTFSARFALPDGKIEIPVKAVSGDEVEEREIDTAVSKKSQSKKPVIR